MFKFLIVLQEIDHADRVTDRYLEKLFSREVIPKIGEEILTGGNGYLVTGVEHDLDIESANDQALHVIVAASEEDFNEILANDATWNFREGYSK